MGDLIPGEKVEYLGVKKWEKAEFVRYEPNHTTYGNHTLCILKDEFGLFMCPVDNIRKFDVLKENNPNSMFLKERLNDEIL